ncbi:DUF433 domain-containing protein [Arsenicicoccus dermatophilus]|uniref:DUF433 domain-containing protein n=1 Tax=Arsenicicoccus dermatophilus TaxID=1076331 RepID=UPI001F4D2B94|nr:DUF433 domain-containing protein [Arsenicicoccus dermatophilus]MCH8613484.1 DUF433 domain-containing protein [Arsenicicoccus dermatophilus]
MDIYRTPILTARDAARHLRMPESTLDVWLKPLDGAEPLVHSVVPERRGWPRVPFVGVIEAHVLRELRTAGIPMDEIRKVVQILREGMSDPYALASSRLATIGDPSGAAGKDSRLFAELDDALVNQHNQGSIREVLASHLRFVKWDDEGRPRALRLSQYPDRAEVIIDPRFAWGSPVLAESRTPIEAVVSLWQAGEPMDVVAEEFDLSRDQVEDICRVAAA